MKTHTAHIKNVITFGAMLIMLLGVASVGPVYAETVINPEESKYPVITEAESGTAGAEWEILKTDDGATQYLTIQTDYNETSSLKEMGSVPKIRQRLRIGL